MAKEEKSSRVTFHVVQPFELRNGEDVVPGEAYEAASASLAMRKAQALDGKTVGAVAFSRTGDVSTGEFEDAVILGMFGVIPDEALDAIRDGTA